MRTLRGASPGSEFLGGGLLGGSEDWRRGGSFNLQLAEADGSNGTGWNLWGQYGLGSSFRPAADADGVTIDGDVSSAVAGADLRVGSFTMGMAVSRATGEIGIDNRLLGPELLDASLTTVLPYLRWSPADGTDLWAMGGYGWGEAGLRDAAGGSDLGMTMAALGGQTELASLGAVSLGLRADAFAGSLGTEAMEELGEVTADVTQSRVALTLGTGFGSAVRFEPKLDIGARMDGGDAETGAGMEVGGSIGLLGANGSVRLDGSGRMLVAHQVEGFEDWGASVSLAIGSPQGGSEGFRLKLEPEWGGGVRQRHDLWSNRGGVGLGNMGGRRRAFGAPGAEPTDVADMWRPARMHLNLDYGLSLEDGAGSLAPFVGFQLDRGAHEMRVGARVRMAGGSADRGLELALLGGRISREGSESKYSAGFDLRGDALRAGAVALAPLAEFRIESARGAIARLGAQLALPDGLTRGSLAPGALSVRLFGEHVRLAGQEPAYRLSLTIGASPLSRLSSALAPRPRPPG